MLPIENRGTLTYSASMTPNLNLGAYVVVTVTDGNAMTINAPTNMVAGSRLLIDFLNSSGGVMGQVTWNAAFLNGGAGTVGTGAVTNPANGKRRVFEFVYNGTTWTELYRSSADM